MLDFDACMHFHRCMKQITVRNLRDKALLRAQEIARRKKVSLNRVYIEAIEKGLNIEREECRFDDLDSFAGDSDFGPEWEEVLNDDLNRVDEKEWR